MATNRRLVLRVATLPAAAIAYGDSSAVAGVLQVGNGGMISAASAGNSSVV
ncbi:hypothetical protein RhoFasGS6_05071 [Rhodococcus fascians]|nr:hypothetical protein [Rhodococcus fascians]